MPLLSRFQLGSERQHTNYIGDVIYRTSPVLGYRESKITRTYGIVRAARFIDKRGAPNRKRGVWSRDNIRALAEIGRESGWMAEFASASRALVEDFVRYKLCQRGLRPEPAGGASCPLHAAMRAAGHVFEERFRQEFSGFSGQIHVTPSTAYPRFAEVAGDLFRDGVNWGRVVAFFVLGAALCVEIESVNTEMSPLNGFLAVYGPGATEEARRQREENWVSLKTVLVGALALGVLVTLGALLARK
ncbi:apoptosis regulator R1-like isoform X2 [Ascaphus truei]|uniref:apoptosis regulator R1-like isoform X2 n=1 Tax=Ascaphus truei TaxID=8439 RepID=UPI003F5AB4C8